MLEASRAEITKHVGDEEHGFRRLGHKFVLILDLYIWEPLCTGARFLHLALIFVPILLAIPAIWIGRRQIDRDNERSGTLWWYGFLVKGMEWAGPAFIKVRAADGPSATSALHAHVVLPILLRTWYFGPKRQHSPRSLYCLEGWVRRGSWRNSCAAQSWP